MKKLILLLISLCSIPVISMHFPNARRVLNFDNSDDSTEENENEKEMELLRAPNNASYSIPDDNQLSNEEYGKGLPEPNFNSSDTQKRKRKRKRKGNVITPANSPKNEENQNNQNDQDNHLIFNAAFDILTSIKKTHQSDNKRIKKNFVNDLNRKSPEKK